MKAIDVEMRAALLERELRRHALRRISVCHDGCFLYANADGEPGPRLHRVGQSRDYSLQEGRASGRVRAEFRLSDSQIEDVREKLKTLPKYEPVFTVEVKDEAGVVIAEVEKLLHVRKK
jgi:hypothetical protein